MRLRVEQDKVIIFSYFVGAILAGSALLVLPVSWEGETGLSYLDALFTATSAVCVTGLVAVDTAGFSAFGQVVIMLLIQCGGLGIVAFAMVYVAMPRRRVSLAQRGIIQDLYARGVEVDPRRITRNIVLATFAIEALFGFALFLRFRAMGMVRPGFTAMFHAVSAFCNAGFSIFPNGLDGFAGDWVVNLVVIALVVLGGLGFTVLQDMAGVYMRRRRRLGYHSRVVLSMTGMLILLGAAAFYALEYDGAYAGMSVPGKLLAALFQSVSPRTAGFETVPQASLGLPSLVVVMMLMFTGGSPGSTAGGVKTTTVFAALLVALRGHDDHGAVEFRGGELPASTMVRALAILARAIVIIAAATVALLVLEAGNPLASLAGCLFEAVSALGTVGLTLGLTPTLGMAGKVLVMVVMFVGRVGLFAMAATRPPDAEERFVDYPREAIMLG